MVIIGRQNKITFNLYFELTNGRELKIFKFKKKKSIRLLAALNYNIILQHMERTGNGTDLKLGQVSGFLI